MSTHTIIGSGAVGSGTALLLADAGHDVVVVTRSGTGPDHADITLVAADATDTDRLTEIADGSTVIYNCANPSDYAKWAELWPPMATAILTAAEHDGRIVFMHQVREGATNQSYGVQVARLAGVPDHVLGDAQRRLRELERDQAAGHPAQADLFATPQAVEPAPPSPVVAALEALDPDDLTPRQALDALYALKRLNQDPSATSE